MSRSNVAHIAPWRPAAMPPTTTYGTSLRFRTSMIAAGLNGFGPSPVMWAVARGTPPGARARSGRWLPARDRTAERAGESPRARPGSDDRPTPRARPGWHRTVAGPLPLLARRDAT